MTALQDTYAAIVDRVAIAGLTWRERDYVSARLDGPSDAYMELVVALDEDGCEFPKVQAALMMLNTPGVAQRILRDRMSCICYPGCRGIGDCEPACPRCSSGEISLG